jgi:hypothetical protein
VYRLNKVYWEARDGSMQDKNIIPLTGARVKDPATILVAYCATGATLPSNHVSYRRNGKKHDCRTNPGRKSISKTT